MDLIVGSTYLCMHTIVTTYPVSIKQICSQMTFIVFLNRLCTAALLKLFHKYMEEHFLNHTIHELRDGCSMFHIVPNFCNWDRATLPTSFLGIEKNVSLATWWNTFNSPLEIPGCFCLKLQKKREKVSNGHCIQLGLIHKLLQIKGLIYLMYGSTAVLT